MKRVIISVIHNVGAAQVIVGATDDITTNSSVEKSMSAQADPDEEEIDVTISYSMFEGTFSELCEAINSEW